MNNELWSIGAMFNSWQRLITIWMGQSWFHGIWEFVWVIPWCHLTSCRHNLPITRLIFIYSLTFISLILFEDELVGKKICNQNIRMFLCTKPEVLSECIRESEIYTNLTTFNGLYKVRYTAKERLSMDAEWGRWLNVCSTLLYDKKPKHFCEW